MEFAGKMSKKLYSYMSDYFNWVVSTYQAIVQINSLLLFPLRLVSVDKDKITGNLYFIVQVTGKNIFPKLDANDIQDSAILSNFSAQDREVIQSYFSIKAKSNKYVSAVTFDRTNKQFIYDLKNCESSDDILVTRLTSKQLKHLLDTASIVTQDDTDYVRHLESSYH